jgi:hypothetical protein
VTRLFELLFVSAVVAMPAQAETPEKSSVIPQEKIEADVAPFELFLVHNSFCEFRAKFSDPAFGTGSFSFDLNPERPYTSPDLYLDKDITHGKQNPELSLFLMKADEVVVAWKLEATVSDISTHDPEVKQRFRYQSYDFIKDMAVKMPQADGLLVALEKKVVFEAKFPKGGTNFLGQAKKCTAVKEAYRRSSSK